MSSSPRTPLNRVEPERLLHQHGEALLRRDFADQSAQDDQLRWWHNRALHGAYGVYQGLTVKGVNPGGRAKVSPGVAFDAFGRELILADRFYINVPETADEYLLVLSYDRPPYHCGERPEGLCQSGSMTNAGVRLRWVRRTRFALTDGVPIAVLNQGHECGDAWARPLARRQERPRIGHGVATAGAAEWDLWIETVGDTPLILGIEVDIDTSSAGFTGIPCYFAQVAVNDPRAPVYLLVLASFSNIANPASDRFTLRLLCPWLFEDIRRVLACVPAEATALQRLLGVADNNCVDLLHILRAAHAPRSRQAARGGTPSQDASISVSWIGIEQRHAAMIDEGIEDGDELHP